LCFLLPHCTSITEREYRTIKSRDHTQSQRSGQRGAIPCCRSAVQQRQQVARKAKEAKTEEQVREKALATAVEEAKRLGKVWSVETTLDKVALCLGNLMESNLRQDLESQPRDPLKSLDYWVELAMSELPGSVAWKAIQTKQPVATVVEQAKVRLQQIRFQPKTIELARRWDMAASHNSGLLADI
jgi:hypothetical protein